MNARVFIFLALGAAILGVRPGRAAATERASTAPAATARASTTPAAVDPAVVEAERARIATIKTLAPAVVAVFQRGGAGGGSGVLIDREGYALTNFHVVGDDHFFKCGLNDGNLYDAVLVGVDPTGDVAVIKLIGKPEFPVVPLGDNDTVRTGDWVYVLGNPFLLAADFQPTTTYGIVSGVHRYQYPAGTFLEYTDCLQVDASVNPGNSGGPLFDHAGKLIGINGRISIAQRGRVNAGAGYAISINQIRNFLGHLRSGRIVDHASLGATVSTDSHGAIVVSQILDQSDAARRGLQIDDEIVSFAGRPIRSVNQFKNVLGIVPEAWKVPIVFRRKGETQEIYARLRPLHSRSELVALQASPEGRENPQPDPAPPKGAPKGTPAPPGLPAPPRGRERRPPRPDRRAKTEAPVSEKLQALYAASPGFANHHFNTVEQQRTLRGLEGWTDARHKSGWSFSGGLKTTTAIAAPFECILTEKFASLEIGPKTFLQQLDQEPQDEPPGTGGLLTALNQMRLLVSQREKLFTTFSYFGTEPLDGRGDNVDVLVSSIGSVESRWYFRAANGDFLGFDTRLLEDAEECEIRFREIGSFDGVRFPGEIVVRHGGKDFATLRVSQVKPHK